jgi:cell division protein FtsL
MAALHRPALPLPGRLAPPRVLAKARSRSGLLLALAAAVLGVALLQVNQFSRLTSTGYQINELNSERAAQQAENHSLEAEVASLSSLARVDWEARTRLHMGPAMQKLYIDVNRPAPARQTLPTRFLPQETPVPAEAATSHESLWKRLLKLLPIN